MQFRTDLAMECRDSAGPVQGVTSRVTRQGETEITSVVIETEEAAREMKKAPGQYVTLYQEGMFRASSGNRAALSRLLGQPEASFSFSPRPEPDRLKQMLALFSRTEPIDAAWPKLLRQLEGALSELTEAACARLGVCSGAVYDRIGGYILYRQLDRLPEYGLDTLRAYAALCVDFVFLCETFSGDLAESLRRWSEQIEYSTENPELLLRAVRG